MRRPSTKQILVVGSDKPLREFVLAVLRNGHDVEISEAGSDAVAFCRAWWPDLVILSGQLSVAPASDLLRRIRTDDQLRETPVIVLSAGDERNDQAIIGEMTGPTTYLRIPFKPAELLDVVASALEREGCNKRCNYRSGRERHRVLRLPDDALARVRAAADSEPDPVERARAIRLGMEHWTTLLRETVADAREQGVPWADIADALGVSRQAATKRFQVGLIEEDE